MAELRRDFLPDDLLAAKRDCGIEGVVSVQARQSIEETQWLIELAEANSFIRGVVGWVPLCEPDVAQPLERWTHHSVLKSIRHVVQDELDGFMDNSAFDAGVKQLGRYDLAYDILIFARQLEEAIRLVDRHPSQRFVLDHIAKPIIESSATDPQWESAIVELAKRENVACKFSGVATEVRDSDWTIDKIRPYWDVVLNAFGPGRLMFGTDWPVCLLRTGYKQWFDTCTSLASGLSVEEKEQFWGSTATHWYKL